MHFIVYTSLTLQYRSVYWCPEGCSEQCTCRISQPTNQSKSNIRTLVKRTNKLLMCDFSFTYLLFYCLLTWIFFYLQDNALALTLKVLLAIKSTQIEEAVGNLCLDDIDILMKYIYRGFECPTEGSSGHLLLWHEKAFNIGGSGSIVRVLSDRMKV